MLTRLFIITLLTANFFAVAEERKTDSFTIGIITDVSGVGAYWGTQMVQGAELARTELKASIPVKVIVEDAALQSSKAVTAAQKLINVDHVDALVVEFTPHIVPALPTINAAKIPTIYIAGAESPLDKSPYVFKMYQSYPNGCRDITRHFVREKLMPIGVLTAQAEYAELCLKGIKEVTNDIVNIEYVRGAAVDTEVLTLKQKGVKAIINAGFEVDTINTLQAMSKIQFHVPLGGSKEDLLTEKTTKEFHKELTGSVAFSLPELSASLRNKFEEFLGKKSITLSQPQAVAQAYLAITALASSLNQCTERDSLCVVSQISKTAAVPEMGFEGFNEKRIGVFSQHVITYGK